jgi:ribosomal protein S18 acetylase RimI-like enzyme
MQPATLTTLHLRHPLPTDLDHVAALLVDCDVAEYGAPATTVDDVRSQWERLHFDLAQDAWLAQLDRGERAAGPEPLAGYVDVWPRDPADWPERRFLVDLYVHPRHRAEHTSLIGGGLLAQAEARARARLAAEGPPGAQGQLLSAVAGADPSGQALHLGAGYAQVGESWIMRVDHGATPPPAPRWPAGVELRPFRPGVDETAAHLLINETFGDLADYRPVPFDNWASRLLRRDDFDPRWWFLAWAPGPAGAEALAGAALCFDEGSKGWVSQIGVRRAWRRQGLALALLHHAFGAFYAAGLPSVELGVNAANATGAVRVYERAGMHVSRRYVRFEKRIQP